MLVERWREYRCHACVGLRQKILNDDFLNVPVAIVKIRQREQRSDTFDACRADADQYAGGEWNSCLACEPDGLETCGGLLVRRAEMRTTALAQTIGSAFEHDALRDRHLAQCRNIGCGKQPGIEMREQTGFFINRARGLRKI